MFEYLNGINFFLEKNLFKLIKKPNIVRTISVQQTSKHKSCLEWSFFEIQTLLKHLSIGVRLDCLLF